MPTLIRRPIACPLAGCMPFGSTFNWQCVDDIVPDDSATYVEGWKPNTLRRDFYGIDKPSLGTAVIRTVTVKYRARKDPAAIGDPWGYSLLRMNLVTQYISEHRVVTNTNWMECSDSWATNPATGKAWTGADLDILEIGIGGMAGESPSPTGGTISDKIQFTQVWVEIAYGSDETAIAKNADMVISVAAPVDNMADVLAVIQGGVSSSADLLAMIQGRVSSSSDTHLSITRLAGIRCDVAIGVTKQSIPWPSSRASVPDRTLEFLGKGLQFPFAFQRRSGGAQISTATSRDHAHIHESIRQILGTRKGERFMRPEFGTRLSELIFEQNDRLLHGLIRHEVMEALDQWEPRVIVTDVIVGPSVTNDHLVLVNINYRLISSQVEGNLVWPFWRELE